MRRDFAILIKYSPLHNVKAGGVLPGHARDDGGHDDRVVPSHSFKFTAAMQAGTGMRRPMLIRVETQASHGYRPTDKRIAELADQWAFAAAAMGMIRALQRRPISTHFSARPTSASRAAPRSSCVPAP